MENIDTSMPVSAEAESTTQNEVAHQTTVAESPENKSFQEGTLRIEDLDPSVAAEMFGLDTTSQQIAEEVGETQEAPDVRVGNEEQSEEPSTDVEIPEDDSTDTDTVEAEADTTAEESTTPPEKLVYDLKELEEQNLVISMKVDGEFKEFDMPSIQKLVGQPTVAEEKSRKAVADREAADTRIAELNKQTEQFEAQSRIMQADNALAGKASLIKSKQEERKQLIADGYKEEARDLKDEIDDLTTEYTTAYNAASAQVKEQENIWLSSQRDKLVKSDLGKKFTSEPTYKASVANFLEGRNLNPNALKVLTQDADLLNMALELHSLKNNVKPTVRKKLPISKAIKGAAHTPRKTNPVAKKGSLQDKLSKGNFTLDDLNENPSLLNDL